MVYIGPNCDLVYSFNGQVLESLNTGSPNFLLTITMQSMVGSYYRIISTIHFVDPPKQLVGNDLPLPPMWESSTI